MEHLAGFGHRGDGVGLSAAFVGIACADDAVNSPLVGYNASRPLGPEPIHPLVARRHARCRRLTCRSIAPVAKRPGTLIARFEGRLLAFVESRLKRRDVAEDVVQESLIGFLNSLPNYDASRSPRADCLRSQPTSSPTICAGEGRRPAIPFSAGDSSSGGWDLAGRDRSASTILRSGERRELKAVALAAAMKIKSIAGARRLNGGRSNAPNCSSYAAGRTRKWPPSLASPSSKWPTKSSISWPACANRSKSKSSRRTCSRNYRIKNWQGKGIGELAIRPKNHVNRPGALKNFVENGVRRHVGRRRERLRNRPNLRRKRRLFDIDAHQLMRTLGQRAINPSPRCRARACDEEFHSHFR